MISPQKRASRRVMRGSAALGLLNAVVFLVSLAINEIAFAAAAYLATMICLIVLMIAEEGVE